MTYPCDHEPIGHNDGPCCAVCELAEELEQAEGMVAALVAAIKRYAGAWEDMPEDYHAITAAGDRLRECAAKVTTIAANHDARIRREALEEADRQWKDAMHALSEIAESWEVSGFALAVIVRIAAIRALLPPSPAESPG